MRRCVSGALASVLVFTGGCEDAADDWDRTTAPTSETFASGSSFAGSVDLHADMPSIRISVGPRRVGRVVLDVTSIDNRNHQGIVLAVDVVDGEDDRLSIGRVSPFPSDRPAQFALGVPAGAAAAFGEEDTAVVVTLLPADDSLLLDASVRVVADVILLA